MELYIYIYIYICIRIHKYIYIYRERERDCYVSRFPLRRCSQRTVSNTVSFQNFMFVFAA